MMRALLFVLCIALPAWASAETINPLHAKSSQCGRYEVFHINGIRTEITGATDNLRQLRDVYGNAHDGHLISYNLAYNQTRGLQDLLDTYDQVVLDFPGATFAAFIRAVVLGVITDPLTAEIVATIAARLATVYDPERPSPYLDSDLLAIETAIRGGHAWNGRMLIVPHSQGTLYANLVHDRLIAAGPQQVEAGSVGIMAVAAPASNVRGTGSTYVTSSNDRVISGVRFVFNNTLPATYTIPVIDSLGHNFIGVYLNPQQPFSRATIVEEMSRVLSQLTARVAVADPGVFAYAHASVWWDDCNRTSYPYGCWFQGTQWFEPVMHSWVPGNPSYYAVTAAGTYEQATQLAAANAAACQALGEAELARLRVANPNDAFPFVVIPGCFNSGGSALNGVLTAITGDFKIYTLRADDNTSVPGSRSFVHGHVGSACRRSGSG